MPATSTRAAPTAAVAPAICGDRRQRYKAPPICRAEERENEMGSEQGNGVQAGAGSGCGAPH